MTVAGHHLLCALLERARTLEHLLERHPAFDLLARFEAALDEGGVLAHEAIDLLKRMEGAIMALEDEAKGS